MRRIGWMLVSTALAPFPAMAQQTGATTQDGVASASPSSAAAARTGEPSVQNDGDGGIGDIVVTAQRRAENVQNVPIAVSAFTAETLQNRAVNTVAQLAAVTPNVTLDAGTPFSGSSSVLSAFIRGIGADDFAFNIDPGVGVYVDGVYLARSVGANQDLLDVERVEVLKGPQGTLFGRNTIGGAISIVTRDPGDRFRLVGDATAGRYDLARIRLTADIPLAPGLAVLLSGSVKTRDGYLKRIPFPDARATNGASYTAFPSAGFDSAAREGGDDDRVFRVKLKYRSGGFTAVLGGDYTRIASSGLPNSVLAIIPNVPGNFAGTANLPGTAFDPTGTTGFLFAGLYNFCIGSTPAQIAARGAQALCGGRGTQFSGGYRLPGFGSVNVDGNPNNDVLPWDSRFLLADKDKSYATGNSFNHLRNWGVNLTMAYDLSQAFTLKSITAYRKLTWRTGVDADGSPLNFVQLSFPLDQKQFSQEVQLLGKALDDRLSILVGGYYFTESGSQRDFVTFAEGLVQVDGNNVFNTRNYAGFGQLDFRVAPWLGLTAGGRYTHEKKRFEGFQRELNGFNYKLFGCSDANGNIAPNGAFPLAPVFVPCQAALGYPDPNDPVRVYPPGELRQTFNNFSPKLGVQLHPNDDIMVYGSWSRGYKTGGWTTRLTNPQTSVDPFSEEKAETWEVGVKSRFLDRQVQFNAAAFTTRYDGIQLNFQQGTSPTIRNAGDARIRGFEVEAIVAPHGTGLTLNAAVGYLDAFYTDVLPGVLAVSGANPFQAGTTIGAPLPKTPHWKFSLGPQYRIPLSGGGAVTLGVDWSHTSSLWNDAQRTFALRRDAADLVNATVLLDMSDDRFQIGAGVTNLLKDRYLTNGNSGIAAGTLFGTYNRPREWYLRFGFRF